MTPSLEIREEAAKLFDAMSDAEDAWRQAFDDGELDLSDLVSVSMFHTGQYEAFCALHGFGLLTDASGLFLRCAKTQIPLVDTDEVIEGDGDKLIRVEREYAA